MFVRWLGLIQKSSSLDLSSPHSHMEDCVLAKHQLSSFLFDLNYSLVSASYLLFFTLLPPPLLSEIPLNPPRVFSCCTNPCLLLLQPPNPIPQTSNLTTLNMSISYLISSASSYLFYSASFISIFIWNSCDSRSITVIFSEERDYSISFVWFKDSQALYSEYQTRLIPPYWVYWIVQPWCRPLTG